MTEYWIPTARFAQTVELDWQNVNFTAYMEKFDAQAKPIMQSIRQWAYRVRVITGLLLALVSASLVASSIPVYSTGTGAGGAPQLFIFFLGAALCFGYLGLTKSNIYLVLRSRYLIRTLFILSILSCLVYSLMQLVWAVLFCSANSPNLDYPGILAACQQYTWILWTSFSLGVVITVGVVAIYICLERVWTHDERWATLVNDFLTAAVSPSVSVGTSGPAWNKAVSARLMLAWIIYMNSTEPKSVKVKYYLPSFEDGAWSKSE